MTRSIIEIKEEIIDLTINGNKQDLLAYEIDGDRYLNFLIEMLILDTNFPERERLVELLAKLHEIDPTYATPLSTFPTKDMYYLLEVKK